MNMYTCEECGIKRPSNDCYRGMIDGKYQLATSTDIYESCECCGHIIGVKPDATVGE